VQRSNSASYLSDNTMLARAGALRRAAAAALRCLASAEASLAAGLPGPASAAHDPPTVQSPPPPQGLPRWASSLEQAAAAAAPSADPFSPRQATYFVEIITGDVRGAGSPAPAAITIFGEDGESESHVIGAEESGAGFQRATRKTYVVYAKDLGSLKRILVQQMAPTELPDRPAADNDDQAATTGWYLDRIEVRGPEGEHWVFPCGAWLGTAATGAPGDAPEERNLIPADFAGRDVHRSSLHDPAHRITQPLAVETSGISLPHPEKVATGAKGVNRKGAGHGGEDSYFYAGNRNGIYALGVADGVYEWRTSGIDAGAFSRQLMEYCRQAVELGTTDVLRVLQFASKHLRRAGTQGSSTVCLALVDTLQGRLAAANIGDSGFMLLGRGPGKQRGEGSGRGQLVVRYRSPQQEHSFGHPYQLGHHAAADAPEDAMLTTMPVYPGDILVMGSDGLFDNVSDEEIVDMVNAAVVQGQPASAIAQALAFAAFGASVDRKRVTPYSLAASAAFDMVYNGGKADDITAVVLELQ
jgi:protein phosphatase PTC7